MAGRKVTLEARTELRDRSSLVLRGGGSAGGGQAFQVDWLSVFGNLFGGLALFLHGMERLGYGLKAAFGSELRRVLLMLSFNRFGCDSIPCNIPPAQSYSLRMPVLL